eukprot:COSAG06_NODE_914_length_11578_cov_31.792926_3_plen_162_part_00
MAIARSTRARVLCLAGRRHTLTTHLACLRLASSTAPGAATLRSHPQPSAWPLSRCGYLRSVIYLLFYASPCLKLKLALVVLSVLRALPQHAAIRNHQPGRCSYLRAPAAVRNPAAGRRGVRAKRHIFSSTRRLASKLTILAKGCKYGFTLLLFRGRAARKW